MFLGSLRFPKRKPIKSLRSLRKIIKSLRKSVEIYQILAYQILKGTCQIILEREPIKSLSSLRKAIESLRKPIKLLRESIKSLGILSNP